MSALATRGRLGRDPGDRIRMARAITALRGRDDWAGLVVRRALVGAAAHAAGARLREIEALRRELAASDAPVERLDFGAGDGELLAAGTYHDGVTVTHTIGDFCRSSCMAPAWARLLFHLVRESAPAYALELGTALGLSAAYQGAALEANGYGRLVTIEGSAPLATLARGHLARLRMGRVEVVTGTFRETLPAVLERTGPLGYVCIDGHHDGRAAQDYFAAVLDALAERAIVVFDDIGVSGGMRDAWRRIAGHPDVTLAVDLHKLGVCGVRR